MARKDVDLYGRMFQSREAKLTFEQEDLLRRFHDGLAKCSGDGFTKRMKRTKPPWFEDPDHEAAFWRHYHRWLDDELVDVDSGAHPLIHCAWRLLAIACKETGNVPGKISEVPPV